MTVTGAMRFDRVDFVLGMAVVSRYITSRFRRIR
jgi:hypothetical protein